MSDEIEHMLRRSLQENGFSSSTAAPRGDNSFEEALEQYRNRPCETSQLFSQLASPSGPSMATSIFGFVSPPRNQPLPPNVTPIYYPPPPPLPPPAPLFRTSNSGFLPEPFVIRTGNNVPPPHPLLSSSTFQSASGVKQIQGAFDQPLATGEKADCPICMEREAIFTSVACGHSLCCKCAQQLQQCPSCRKPYGLIVRVYR